MFPENVFYSVKHSNWSAEKTRYKYMMFTIFKYIKSNFLEKQQLNIRLEFVFFFSFFLLHELDKKRLLKIKSVKSKLKKPSLYLVNLPMANRHFSFTKDIWTASKIYVICLKNFHWQFYNHTSLWMVNYVEKGSCHGNSSFLSISCSPISVRVSLLSSWEFMGFLECNYQQTQLSPHLRINQAVLSLE